MNISGVDLNLLAVFDALFAERNVTRAAMKVGLSQPAFSSALNRLRAQLGDHLFTRSSHGMLPTARSLEVAETIHWALAEIGDALSTERRHGRKDISGSVSVISDEYLQIFLIPRLLARIGAEAPGVSLKIRGAGLVNSGPASPDADLALVYRDRRQHGDVLRAPLCSDRLLCLVRKGLAGSHRQLTRELFSILSHVQWGGDDEQELTAALLNAGLARRIGARVACLLATPWMVAQSDMSATVPARFARWAAGSFAVDVLEPPVPLPKVSWASSWSRRSERNAAVTWVRDKLIEAGRSLDEDE